MEADQGSSGSILSVCPHCYRHNILLLPIPEGLFLILKDHSFIDIRYPTACRFCLEDFQKFRKSPVMYMEWIKKDTQEKNRKWRDRVDIIKDAYKFLQAENLEDAEAKYDKYIDTIADVLGVPFRDITAPMFAKHGRPDELNTFVLILWDIVMLYDMKDSPNLQLYASKFVEVSQTSVSRRTLIHSIKKYLRKARNKRVFRQMLLDMKAGRGCFIATYVFANAYSQEVMQLRAFRDQVLMPSRYGRALVRIYYRVSPVLVALTPAWIARSRLSQWSLRKIASTLNARGRSS
jgi:hypothetical protein